MASFVVVVAAAPAADIGVPTVEVALFAGVVVSLMVLLVVVPLSPTLRLIVLMPPAAATAYLFLGGVFGKHTFRLPNECEAFEARGFNNQRVPFFQGTTTRVPTIRFLLSLVCVSSHLTWCVSTQSHSWRGLSNNYSPENPIPLN